MLVDIEVADRALRIADGAKDLQPKVRVLLAESIAGMLSEFADDETELTFERLMDIRGSLRGVLAFSIAVDSAIKSGSIYEKEEA